MILYLVLFSAYAAETWQTSYIFQVLKVKIVN